MNNDANNAYLSAQRLFEKRDLKAAKQGLDELLKNEPKSLEALHLAARVAGIGQDWEQSRQYLTQAIDVMPDNARLHYEYGVTLENLSQIDGAIESYRHAIETDPKLAEAHRRLADLMRARGDLEQARAHYQHVLDIRPDQYETLTLFGHTMEQLGQTPDFIRYCRRLIDRMPDYAGAYLQLGIALRKQGDIDAAMANYLEVIARDPGCYDAYWYTGITHRAQGNMDEAIDWLQKAIQAGPQRSEAKALLCDTYEMVEKLEDAEQLAREVLEQDANNASQARVLATTVLASIFRRTERVEEGYALLSAMDIPNDPNEAQGAYFELGRLADALGNHKAAFEHFKRGNAALAIAQNARDENKTAYHQKITSMRATFTSAWVSTWRTYPRDTIDVTPVFIVGFPRSGTTLVDRVLNCHPNIQVMEERPVLSGIQREIERMTGNDLKALANLTTDQWRQLRTHYLSIAGQYTEPGQGSLIVDKLPLNLIWAGICHWLFPEARFIFSIRHPCDVVLSCFMQSFVSNLANSNFYTVEDGALLYDRVMDLWYHYRSVLPIDCHPYRYEDLVDDFEGTVRGILDFLEQPWHPDLMHFDQRARERGHVRIPSYWQVSQPIYRSAHFRWQRYRDQMADVLPLLEPWAKRFGYED